MPHNQVQQGHYYLGNHCRYTEVAEPVYRRSLLLGQGSFLVGLLGAVMLLPADLPARRRGPRPTRSPRGHASDGP